MKSIANRWGILAAFGNQRASPVRRAMVAWSVVRIPVTGTERQADNEWDDRTNVNRSVTGAERRTIFGDGEGVSQRLGHRPIPRKRDPDVDQGGRAAEDDAAVTGLGSVPVRMTRWSRSALEKLIRVLAPIPQRRPGGRGAR